MRRETEEPHGSEIMFFKRLVFQAKDVIVLELDSPDDTCVDFDLLPTPKHARVAKTAMGRFDRVAQILSPL
jgi:hypothetical protein